MNYLSVKNLSKYYGERLLFEDLTFGIGKGQRIAFVASNGSGKSTLFKIIAGLDVADEGEISKNAEISVGYLLQDPPFDGSESIKQYIEGKNSEVLSVIHDYEALVADYDPNKQKELDELSAKMDALQAWDYQRKLTAMLDRFRITNLDQSLHTLSGGQKKRLALALLLIDEPDLLLLDEPTNHLDIDMIEWLEEYLSTAATTVFLITHDRYFLDKVSNQILELYGGKLYVHEGNYAYYLEKKAERENIFKTELEKSKKQYKKELEWMRRSPQARTTKAKSRIDKFYALENKVKQKKVEDEFEFNIKQRRQGGKILELKQIRKAFGEKKIIDKFTYTFNKGDRIGIVGENGSGKTTFLNMLVGTEPADAGRIVRGDNLHIGYYKQDNIALRQDKTVLETLKEVAEIIEVGEGRALTASQFLQYFMFSPNTQYTPVAKLSGGERKRLQLIMVLMKNPNFLILDEPTNDLDLPTLSKLEEFLEAYKGVLLMVSHDRYFMDQLVDHLFAFEGNGFIKDHICTYTEYRQQKAEKNKVKSQLDSQPKKSKNNDDLQRSKKEKNEIKKLERTIEQLEEEKTNLEQKLFTITDLEEIQKISQRVATIIEEIDIHTERWMELV